MLFLLSVYANAAISTVGQGFFIEPSVATPGALNIGIDAGSTADMLIVGVGAELGPPEGNAIIARYDGFFMPLATGNFRHSSIFYLDLNQTSYSGGLATLSVIWDFQLGGSLGVSWVSIDADLQPGQSIELHSTASSEGVASVELVSTVDETFNFVHFTANKSASSATILLSENLSEIYSIEDNTGSARHAAGYDLAGSSGVNAYNWSVSSEQYRRIDAASFAIVPEPSVSGIIAGLLCVALTAAVRRH